MQTRMLSQKPARPAPAPHPASDALLSSLRDAAREAGRELRGAGRGFSHKASELAQNALGQMRKVELILRKCCVAADDLSPSVARRLAEARDQVERVVKDLVDEMKDRAHTLDLGQAARSAFLSALEAVQVAAADASKRIRRMGTHPETPALGTVRKPFAQKRRRH